MYMKFRIIWIDDSERWVGSVTTELEDAFKQVYFTPIIEKFVEIELKNGEDDPQLIFESLNSTGLDLTEADKVRNFILMKDYLKL